MDELYQIDLKMKIIELIKERGWVCNADCGCATGRAFAYTIGFYEQFKHPEIIITGIEPKQAYRVLFQIYNAIKYDNKSYDTSQIYTNILANEYPVLFTEVEHSNRKKHAELLDWYYQKDNKQYKFYQLVWSDNNRLFPWQEGSDQSIVKNQYFI